MSSLNWVLSVFRFTWRAVVSNPSLHVLFLLYSLALLLLSAFPVVGFFFSILWQISLFSVGTYLSRRIVESEGSESAFEERIKGTSFGEYLFSHPDTALGAFVGTFLLTFIFQMVVLMVGIATFGREFVDFILSKGPPPDLGGKMDVGLLIGVLLLLVVFLVVLWVAPLVYGYVFQQEGFTAAMAAVFKVFNYDFFKSSLRISYLIMYSLFTVASLLLGGIGALLTGHPVTVPLGLALLYGVVLLYFSFATHAYLLCKPA